MAAQPFWTFSLRLYRRPGVAPACLALQDRLGIDVNMLLFCLWAGSRGIVLPAATIKAAVALSSEWSATVVRPLRGVRRALKPQNQPALRAKVAGVELAAEKVEQDLLFALVGDRSGGRMPRTAGEANVDLYFRRARLRASAADRKALAAIFGTAFPDAP